MVARQSPEPVEGEAVRRGKHLAARVRKLMLASSEPWHLLVLGDERAPQGRCPWERLCRQITKAGGTIAHYVREDEDRASQIRRAQAVAEDAAQSWHTLCVPEWDPNRIAPRWQMVRMVDLVLGWRRSPQNPTACFVWFEKRKDHPRDPGIDVEYYAPRVLAHDREAFDVYYSLLVSAELETRSRADRAKRTRH